LTVSVVAVPSGRTVAVLEGALPSREDVDWFGGAISPDGSRALTDDGRRLLLWDARSGRQLARLNAKGQVVQGWRFSADGRRVLVTFGAHAAAFDAADGRKLASFPGELTELSDDGALAIKARGDGAVDVSDVASGLTVPVQTDTATPLTSVAFSTPGVLVVGDDGGDAHVLRCAICAPDATLLERARHVLELEARVGLERPPVQGMSA
jgi:hypothetical protein